MSQCDKIGFYQIIQFRSLKQKIFWYCKKYMSLIKLIMVYVPANKTDKKWDVIHRKKI